MFLYVCEPRHVNVALMAVVFEEAVDLKSLRHHFKTARSLRLSANQLAIEEGKYLGPGEETCISPP